MQLARKIHGNNIFIVGAKVQSSSTNGIMLGTLQNAISYYCTKVENDIVFHI